MSGIVLTAVIAALLWVALFLYMARLDARIGRLEAADRRSDLA